MSTRKGVWNLQQVRDKYLQSLWVNDNFLWAWGGNDNGALGLNETSPTKHSSPTQIPGDTWKASGSGNNEVRLISGAYAKYAIKDNGTIWSWGTNQTGELGQNNQGPSTMISSPMQIGSDTTWSSLGGGFRSMAAVKTDGSLWTWGDNNYGELGQNQPGNTRCSSPVQIPGTNWSSVNGGGANFLGRKTDGTLWSWGYGGNGRQGQNSTVSYSSPVQIPGSWSEQFCSNQQTVTAIKTDGTLWAWGRNYEGQLGQNQAYPGLNNASSPIQVGSGSDWAILAKSAGHKTRNPIAIKTDGSLWTWGDNEYGQLGQNQPGNTRCSSPVQVPGTWSTTVKPTANNYSRAIWAVKSDGTLWAWGHNADGQFGVNKGPSGFDYRSSPVQVPGDATWGDIAATGFSNSAHGITVGLTPSQL